MSYNEWGDPRNDGDYRMAHLKELRRISEAVRNLQLTMALCALGVVLAVCATIP